MIVIAKYRLASVDLMITPPNKSIGCSSNEINDELALFSMGNSLCESIPGYQRTRSAALHRWRGRAPRI